MMIGTIPRPPVNGLARCILVGACSDDDSETHGVMTAQVVDNDRVVTVSFSFICWSTVNAGSEVESSERVPPKRCRHRSVDTC